MKTKIIQAKNKDIELIEKFAGIFGGKEDSVEEVRKIRKVLSKQKFNLDEINKLAD